MAESITRKNIDLDILDYYDGKIKNYVDDKVGTGSLTIDDTLSDTSTNPVQNKVVMSALAEKALKSKYGDTTIDVGRKLNTTVGTYSTAEGYQTTASGAASNAEGCETTASKMGSHAEGRETTASGQYSHSEGYSTTASGLNSHAEGETTTASGDYSHAEGYYTTAIGDSSHAEGRETTASKNNSHAEGTGTTASGYASHAEGQSTTASGDYSHAGGHHTQALKEAEFAHGQYNQSNDNTLFSIGDGTAYDARHNAFEITTTGGKLHDKDIATTDLIPTIPTSLPANGGNADTVDGVHAWNMHTLAAGGGSHGSGNHLMYCKHNVLGNGKFYIGVTDGYERAVAVNFAENADTVDDIHIHCVNDGTSGSSWFAVFGATNDIRAVDPARAYVGSSGGVTCSLIGTASGCQYSTILAWANAQTTSTFASVVAAAGFPSDAPYQQEALLQVQVDYYHQRKIVTWTRYLGGSNPQIRQRAIFGEAWNDNDWRVVCG